MTLTLTDKAQPRELPENEFCEQQLYEALSRYHSMLCSIDVTIQNPRSSRGRRQKTFRVQIRHESGEIMLIHRGEEFVSALTAIVKRAEKAVSRTRVPYLTRLSGEI